MSEWQFTTSDYDADDLQDFESKWPDSDASYAAQDAAEYYHDNCDGWEASWPILFTMYYEGKAKGVFSVDRESRPHFYAYGEKKTSVCPHCKAEALVHLANVYRGAGDSYGDYECASCGRGAKGEKQ